MIVALLTLIVFILLFGAGVVKGWLANAAALAFGGLIFIVLICWIGSFFGPDGPAYIFLGGMTLLLVFAVCAKAGESSKIQSSDEPPQRFHSRAPNRAERKKLRKQYRDSLVEANRQLEPPPAHRVWGWYVADIRERFSPASQDKARAFYAAGDANGLDRFCRAELDRINGLQSIPDQSA